ncbi:MAG: hypothetical protein Q4F75_07270 [Pseudomonadota bacterium]|nr:hypothetical protein [Pseudomonadota bacterium]
MFRGLAALFKSGLILNPMVLSGIAFGIFMAAADMSKVFALYKDWHFYLLAAMWAVLYNIGFQKRYHDGGEGLDYQAMLQNVLGSAAMFLISVFCAASFVFFIFF